MVLQSIRNNGFRIFVILTSLVIAGTHGQFARYWMLPGVGAGMASAFMTPIVLALLGLLTFSFSLTMGLAWFRQNETDERRKRKAIAIAGLLFCCSYVFPVILIIESSLINQWLPYVMAVLSFIGMIAVLKRARIL